MTNWDYNYGDTILVRKVQAFNVETTMMEPQKIHVVGHEFEILKNGDTLREEKLIQRTLELIAEKEELQYEIDRLRDKIDELRDR